MEAPKIELHADDCAKKLYVNFLLNKKYFKLIYNIGTGEDITIKKLAKKI